MNREAEIIRDQMAFVRQSLNSDVADVVETAHELIDWKVYVKRYPWVFLGAAAAAGFAIVPRKTNVIGPSDDDIVKMVRKKQIVVGGQAKQGIFSTLLTLAATAAMRSVLTNVGAKANHFMAHANANRRSPSKERFPDEVQRDQQF